MSKNIVIIVLSILVVAFGGFIVYDKFINESTNNIVNNGNVNGNNKKDNTVYTDNVKLSQFENVIENELSGIEAFNSLSEVSNENKLILLYNQKHLRKVI